MRFDRRIVAGGHPQGQVGQIAEGVGFDEQQRRLAQRDMQLGGVARVRARRIPRTRRRQQLHAGRKRRKCDANILGAAQRGKVVLGEPQRVEEKRVTRVGKLQQQLAAAQQARREGHWADISRVAR